MFMNPPKIVKLNGIKFKLVALVLVALSAYTVSGQNTPAPTDQQSPLNMLVLGDSIMWGQGLKTEHKSWHHVKVWLEKTTSRAVIERVEAHSGALIERSSSTERLTAPNAEVDLALPTLNEELDSALRFYSDGSKIDVVLISGCANDVGTQNLLNANATEEIDDMTEAKCGAPMERLLNRVTRSFPAARVIVTGYYPFFSEKTRNDFTVKGMVRRFFKIIAGTPKLSSKEVLARLTANSNEWYHASNRALKEAVRKANGGVDDERRRVMFAKIEFSPEHSFSAPETRLWELNRSPFRLLLVLLSFGKVLLPSNDEMRKQRSASCKEVFNQQPSETVEQKKEREKRRLLCRYAALGHPNQKGAVLYADAIMNLLKGTVGVTASNPP
jgi:lysophospholipase L1-like esterase